MIEPVALLKDLVRINTTNPPGEEEKLLLYLERILQEHRIPYVYQKSAKGRGNLLAWQLADQAEEAPLILMSHTDVVAAQASQWKFPPFEAQEVDGYIYGRGTVDTKQLTAMELTAFLALKEKEIPLKRDVYFWQPRTKKVEVHMGSSGFWIMRLQLVKRQKQAASSFGAAM